MKRLKKYKNNEYSLTESNIWVRDPTTTATPLDINNLTSKTDYQLFIDNEVNLKSYRPMMLEEMKVQHSNCIIVSDGYNFDQNILAKITTPHITIGINGSLSKWNHKISKMDYYVVNNPYTECIKFLPKTRYYPTCILASRTNPDFIKKYKGTLVRYIPTYDEGFSGMEKKYTCKIDDYRNPLCAALNIANFFKAENILLLNCDDSFKDERDGSTKLENGLFAYPQHKITHEIIDELARFIKINDEFIRIKDYSNSWNYNNIPKLTEEGVYDFFGSTE